MLDPRLTLDRLGGLARGAHLQRLGVDRPALARAVRLGRIDRVRQGLFASPALPSALRRAASHGGALTCSAALRHHGVWVLADADRVHVWVGRRGRIHEHDGCRCGSHFFRGTVPLGVVDVETALIHLFRCEGDESFFASLESALHRGLLSRAALLRVRSALPASARWLTDLAHAHSESGLESILRVRLHLLGILLTAQVAIDGVGRVDFVLDGRLILEVDGRENHAGRDHRHRDLVRDAAASARGYETLRFDYAQVIHDWPTVQAAIEKALLRSSDHA
ncbi:type IV toxin-antitoxin system AbiEi family antitoxin domain-containing protein [Microbacterium sp. H83]|uniref:type IV toxin-antitoxin system AbiEi family antitoxin domain-containing protein n=1 Tax=Microbacterium sp. H83 TaxID=1827324 RepID=UPI0007F5600B|nr:type IV toxin-antitoxin system AbiEi family antitoxin domain-containing protein [Microbacterium sp. H83]OAN33649.1 hypothetical protein A4X16_06575 [Microbacterium sp. H83]